MTPSRAAVFHGPGKPLELVRWQRPSPGEGEVVVRVLGCTLCASDLHSYHGRRPTPLPTVLGHEIVGEIAAFGEKAPRQDLLGQPLQVGDRITWTLVASCEECFYCLRGLPQKCRSAFKYGHEPIRPGREHVGGVADHCLLIPHTGMVKLPVELPLEVVCPAGCATATMAAALAAAGDLAGRSVLVLGGGMLGLTGCAMAAIRGADPILLIDPEATRRQRALTFGASESAAPEQGSALVSRYHEGLGVDVILECSGSPGAFSFAWDSLRMGGTLVLVGSVFPAPAVPLHTEQIVRRQLTLRGVHNYHPAHLCEGVRFLEQHHRRFPFADLVGAWFPLSQAVEAFEAASDPSIIRVGIYP